MKKKTVFILFMTLLLAFETAAQQKYALVIGNEKYKYIDTLNNPRNDANDMGAALKSVDDWNVVILLDANKTQINNAVSNLKNRLSASRNSYGFVFYAGHAVQVGGENYLIPIDANYPDETVLKENAPSLQNLLNELNKAGNELNIVVMDACRDNPFVWAANNSPNPASGSRSIANDKPRGLANIQHIPTSNIIVFATAAGYVADDGAGRNGLYTSHFLKNMKTPGITVKDLIDKTGTDVFNASGGRQRPALYSEFNGVARLGRPVNPPPPPIANPFLGRWRSTITSNNETITCILNFKNNGQIEVERYDTNRVTRGLAAMWFTNDIKKGRGYGTYSYQEKGNVVTMYISLTISGVSNEFAGISTNGSFDKSKPHEFNVDKMQCEYYVTGKEIRDRYKKFTKM